MSKIIKDGAYVTSLDEYAGVGTHWIALYILNIGIVYFDIFEVEYIPKEIKKCVENKTITTNIFRIQANGSIMCGYFCIGLIDFMIAGETLID